MIEGNPRLLFELLVCMAVLLITIAVSWSKRFPSVGLPVSYLLSIALIHWIGAFAHSLSGNANEDSPYVSLGFEQCFYGVISFAVGSLIVAPLLFRKIFAQEPHHSSSVTVSRLPEWYIVAGICSFTILAPILRNIPSIGALSICGIFLAIVGFCLACWRDWHAGKVGKMFFWLACVSAIPAVTVVTIGFIGYGATAAMIVFAFVFSFYRPRWQVVIGASVAFFFALSLFITYFRDRTALRELIIEEEGYAARIDNFATTLRNFELADLSKDTHLQAIDLRLNQNIFVGRAVEYIDSGAAEFAHGSTLWNAVVAMVPRIIWPNKPVRAGGLGIVSEYTGLEFAEGTSFGVGHVMEFYINFGTTGVLLGFLIFGIAVRVLDAQAAKHLYSGDWTRFTAWFLPALSLLNTGGNLVEVTGTAAASIVLVLGLNTFIFRKPSAGSITANR